MQSLCTNCAICHRPQVKVEVGFILAEDQQAMTRGEKGLIALTKGIVTGRLRGLAKSSRDEIQPKYLRDVIKLLIFYH